MKKRVYRTAIAAMLIAGYAVNAGAVEIKDVLKEINSNNLTLRAAAQNNSADNLELRSDNTLPATAIEYSPFFRSGVTGLASSELIVRQDFDFPTLYHSRSKVADTQQVALEKGLDAERAELLTQARIKCLELIYNRHTSEILSQRKAAGDSLLVLYEEKLRLRSATILELNKIKLEQSEIEREIAENDMAATLLIQELTALNGGKALDLAGLEYDVESRSVILPESIDGLMAVNPGIGAAEAGVKSAEAEVSLGKQSWVPTLSVGYRRNTEGTEASNGFLVGAEFPLFSIGKKGKAASARLAAARLTLESTLMDEKTRLDSELESLHTLQKSIATYDTPLINETLSLYKESLQAGGLSLSDYYTETSFLYDRLQTRARLENEFQSLLASFYKGKE